MGVNGNVLVLDVEPQTVVNAHILISDPDQRKKRKKITSPARQEELETSDQQKKRRDVVTEAILASEEIEKLALQYGAARLALRFAKLPRFAKDRLVSDRPCHRGDRYRQHKERQDLRTKGHALRCQTSGSGLFF